MRNITITVEEKVARWARVWAARHDSSVSRLVGALLAEKMERDRGYQAAMRRDMVRPPLPLKASGTSYPKRGELHERSVR